MKKPAFGEMCQRDAEGNLTNGDLMNDLLGDEPDVSWTSRAVAREMGFTEEEIDVMFGPAKGFAAVLKGDEPGPACHGDQLTDRGSTSSLSYPNVNSLAEEAEANDKINKEGTENTNDVLTKTGQPHGSQAAR